MKAIWELCFGDVSSIIFNVIIIAAGVIIILQLAARKKELEAGLTQLRKTFQIKHKKYTTDAEGLPKDTAHLSANAFLIFNYGDDTSEQVVVPMVRVNGTWMMK